MTMTKMKTYLTETVEITRATLLLPLVCALLGLAVVLLVHHEHRAMPCSAGEVYVWLDERTDEAGCVSSTDHDAHAGH